MISLIITSVRVNIVMQWPSSSFADAFAKFTTGDILSEMLKGLVKATVPVVKLGVKVGICGGAVYATKEVAATFFNIIRCQ